MILTLSLTLLIFILLYIRNVSLNISGFPVFHDALWILRHSLTRKRSVSMSRLLFQCMEDMYKKHAKDGLCMAYHHTGPVLYVFSEEPVKMFLNDKIAINKPKEYKVLADGFGNGLITSNDQRWKSHRKLLSPAFQMTKLKEKVSLFNEHASALIEDLKSLENRASSDHLQIIQRHYCNSLCESVFGVKPCKENEAQLSKYFEGVEETLNMNMYRMYQPWLWFKPTLYLTSSGRKYLKGCKEMHDFARYVIIEMQKSIASNKYSDATGYFSKRMYESLAYLLLQYYSKDPSFTIEDVHSHVNTFICAGYDTVSYSTMWCLYTLGLYPEFQEKAYQEVQSGNYSYITYEEMNSFTYLEAFIMETLRLYPTIPIFARSISEDVEISKYKVPKGMSVVFPVYFWHRNPENYPEPETFDPERFLSSKERKPWMHIPFGEGNRVCLGKKYAMMEMKIFLAYILRNFKITSLSKKEDLELRFSVILTAEKPLLMLFTPR